MAKTMDEVLKEIETAKNYFSEIEFVNPADGRTYKIEKFDGMFDWTAKSTDCYKMPLTGEINTGATHEFSISFFINGTEQHYIKVLKSELS